MSTSIVMASHDFDVIVIGGGAGGAAFAHASALAGRSVLLIERGPRSLALTPPRDERSTLLEKRPYDDRTVEFNAESMRLMMGGILGGGTAVFGGAMLRPSREDFTPGRFYAKRLDRSQWEWPICYDELEPYYREAEELFRVARREDDEFGPLEYTGCVRNWESLPLAPINERLMAANRRHGLRPFQLPLAIDTDRCQRCADCAGFLCPNGARRSAATVLTEIAATRSVQLLVETEVERLEFGGNRRSIDAIVVWDRRSQTRFRLRGKYYALAAGALASPALLMRSGIEGPHVGRNYMFHFSPLAIGLFVKPTGGDTTFIKQVGFADFYFGTADCREKMGLVQSLPVPGPLILKKSGLGRWPGHLIEMLRRRMLPLAGIVEDLPDPRNRVQPSDSGRLTLTHQFSDFDRRRGRYLARAMREILRRAGAALRITKQCPPREHVGHQCGTLRFGRTPETAVVDPTCRLFQTENLYVVDGSILPTSLGVGPSLTIVANAIRVARHASRCH